MDINGFSQSRYNVLSKMLQSIAMREGIADAKFDISKGSEKGEGYIGEKHAITIRGNGHKTVQLFVKAVPSDEKLRQALDLRLIYLTEILFYKEIMPTFVAFQTRKNVSEPFNSVVECVDTCSDIGNELLIFRNVKSIGYELWDKMKQMNPEHVKFVYTEYGKYHGLSYALRDQQPELYKELIGKFLLNPFKMLGEKMMDGCRKMADNAKALFDPIKEAEVYETYSAFVDYLPKFVETLPELKDKYFIIMHGDCWCNNIMFKYENSNKKCPSKMCLLDFQLITEGSPVQDLSYFTYSSASKEIYDNLDYYLHVYHDSLSKTIRDLGSDPDVLFPFNELKNQWKLYSKFGLMMAIILLKVCIQEQDETVELSESLEESAGMDMMIGFMRPNKYDYLYHERLKNLIVHMVENKFI